MPASSSILIDPGGQELQWVRSPGIAAGRPASEANETGHRASDEDEKPARRAARSLPAALFAEHRGRSAGASRASHIPPPLAILNQAFCFGFRPLY
jgi:hypothetical protein